MAKKQKRNALFWIIFILLVVAGLWYYNKMPEESIVPVQNVSPPAGIQIGDLVTINFVLEMTNGTVVDTNNEAIAKEYGIGTYTKGPYKFIAGQSGKVKGFDHAVVGMEPGRNYTRIIIPSEPVLTYQINRTKSISRNQPLPRFQPFPLGAFEKLFGKKPILNDVVSNPEIPWAYKIINITEKHVIGDPIVVEGKTYRLPSLEWDSTLLVVTFNDLMFRHNPVEGQTINTEFGEATAHPGLGRINITYKTKLDDIITYGVPLGMTASMVIPQKFKVTESNDDSFTITRIDYLPQETLVLKAEVLEWEKEVKEVSGEIIGTIKVS